ncbi:MAG: hypothetical protein LBL05_02800 [Synergistaceae bacterium]|jgi:hypothetical protein|nr:hypothetical protein [Synergistaceae bacterium]
MRKIFRHSAQLFLTAGIVVSVFAVKAWADILAPDVPELTRTGAILESVITIFPEWSFPIVFGALFLFSVLMFYKKIMILRFYKRKTYLTVSNIQFARQQNPIYLWLRLWLFIVFWAFCMIVFGSLLIVPMLLSLLGLL